MLVKSVQGSRIIKKPNSSDVRICSIYNLNYNLLAKVQNFSDMSKFLFFFVKICIYYFVKSYFFCIFAA